MSGGGGPRAWVREEGQSGQGPNLGRPCYIPHMGFTSHPPPTPAHSFKTYSEINTELITSFSEQRLGHGAWAWMGW